MLGGDSDLGVRSLDLGKRELKLKSLIEEFNK